MEKIHRWKNEAEILSYLNTRRRLGLLGGTVEPGRLEVIRRTGSGGIVVRDTGRTYYDSSGNPLCRANVVEGYLGATVLTGEVEGREVMTNTVSVSWTTGTFVCGKFVPNKCDSRKGR